jgi:hypothetical protein
MRTVRKVEAEWRQVMLKSARTGAQYEESSTGRFGLLYLTKLQSVLAWRAFSNWRAFYFFNFPFFSCRGEPQKNETADTELVTTGARLFSEPQIQRWVHFHVGALYKRLRCLNSMYRENNTWNKAPKKRWILKNCIKTNNKHMFVVNVTGKVRHIELPYTARTVAYRCRLWWIQT